jgi:hypothetical protein
MNRSWIVLLLMFSVACATQAPDVRPSPPPVGGATAAATAGPAGSELEPPVPEPVRVDPEAQIPGAAGLGDLMIAPTRIVLEGSRRVAEVLLVNVGDVRGTYRISLVDYRMDEKGSMTELAEGEGEKSAAPIVRFSPRQVTLDPNYSQTIRIQLRKPADLEPGEYRSHLLFRSVPAAETLEAGPEQPAEPEGLTIRLTPVFGISIPLIVRHGEGTSAASLRAASLESGERPVLNVRIDRDGTRSVFGSLVIRHRPSGGGGEQVVGILDGVAVYPPLDYREIAIPLDPNIPLGSGSLTVTYSDLETPSRGVLAETSLRID